MVDLSCGYCHGQGHLPPGGQVHVRAPYEKCDRGGGGGGKGSITGSISAGPVKKCRKKGGIICI